MSEKQMDWSDKGIKEVYKTAWVECCNVNPSNPLAVAQNIGKMVKALKDVVASQQGKDFHDGYNAMKLVQDVLSAIEKKG